MFAISYWNLYDTISDSISIRDTLLGLYDTISDSISIRDILFTEGELGLYDTISDAQPEGQGHSISIRDMFIAMLCIAKR